MEELPAHEWLMSMHCIAASAYNVPQNNTSIRQRAQSIGQGNFAGQPCFKINCPADLWASRCLSAMVLLQPECTRALHRNHAIAHQMFAACQLINTDQERIKQHNSDG